MEIADIRERSRLQNTNLGKRRWPILKCIVLSMKMFYIMNISCRFFYLATQPPKITRESLREAGCLEEEAKVCFISLALRFSSSVLPSSSAPRPP
jgi:hypothetical protein